VGSLVAQDISTEAIYDKAVEFKGPITYKSRQAIRVMRIHISGPPFESEDPKELGCNPVQGQA